MSPRTALTASATAAAALLLALTGCSGSPSATPADPVSAAPAAQAEVERAEAEAPAEPEAPAAPGLGTPVTSGSFEFTAIAITDIGTTVGSGPLSQTAQGTYVQIDLRVANVGTKGEMFLVNYVTLIDGEGREFDADSMAAIYASPDSNTWISTINPGNAVEGPVIFDVPAGTQLASLKVADSLFSSGENINLQ